MKNSTIFQKKAFASKKVHTAKQAEHATGYSSIHKDFHDNLLLWIVFVFRQFKQLIQIAHAK